MGTKPRVRVHFCGATAEPQEAALVRYRGGQPTYTAAAPATVDTRALMELLGAPPGRDYGRQFESPGRTYEVSFGAQSVARPPGRKVAGVCLFDNGSEAGLRALRAQAFLALHTGVFRPGAASGVVVCIDDCGALHARVLDARERAVRTALVEAGLPGDALPVVHLDVRRALARDARWLSAIEALAETLDEQVPPIEGDEEPFRMPIEDTFVIKGRGTVVTGRVERGSVRLGQEVDVVGPAGAIATRIAGVEMFRRIVSVATAPDNVGLLLGDTPRELTPRGAVLAAKGTLTAVLSASVRVVRLAAGEGAGAGEGDERLTVCRVLRGVEFADVELAGDDEACELRTETAVPWERGAPLALYRPGAAWGETLEGVAFAREG